MLNQKMLRLYNRRTISIIVATLFLWHVETGDAMNDVTPKMSINTNCSWNYTVKNSDGFELYKVFVTPIDNTTYYLEGTTTRRPKFEITLLGEENDAKRQLYLTWETSHQSNVIRVSFADLVDKHSARRYKEFNFQIEKIRHSPTRREFRLGFDCIEIPRGVNLSVKVCDVNVHNRSQGRPTCNAEVIDTIRCSCEGVTVHINETQSDPFGPIEMFYSIPVNLKMSVDILYNGIRMSTDKQITLDHNNDSVKIPHTHVIPYNYTVHIKIYCEDYSTLGADQECYSRSFNITTSLTSGNSVDSINLIKPHEGLVNMHKTMNVVIPVSCCVVLISICVSVGICVRLQRKRHIYKARVGKNENSKPLLEFQESRELYRKHGVQDSEQWFKSVNKRDNANRFRQSPVGGESKELAYITSESTYHTTKCTMISKSDGLYSISKGTGPRNTNSPDFLKDLRGDTSNISTSSNLRVEEPDQVEVICKESKFNEPLENICVVTPVFAGESAESNKDTQEINDQNGHENEQDVDWGRVFTFLIPKLCTKEWRFFAIQLLSKVLPPEDNIDAAISRLEQQSKSACSGDDWNHKLYTILSHWKTLSEVPTVDDIRDALRNSWQDEILNEMRNWKIPLKPKPNEAQGTTKNAISLPELEYRIEQRSTNMQVFPCFEMKRQLDQPGASHISSETDFNYQYAQRDVYIGQKRKFACFNEGNCNGNPVIDFTVQLTENEKMCIKLVYEVLHLDAERILDNEEFRVYVKYVISIIQKETSREMCLVDIIKLKFEHYEDCEQIQSTRNGTMHIISSRRCRIILMDNNWKFLKLYVERARSQIIERFPDSDKAYLFLTHDGKQVSNGYIGVDETNSTRVSRKNSETYKRRRTSEPMAVVPRKKMNTASSRMRESSSEESDHESTETNSDSSNTEDSPRGSLVRRGEKWCRRRRSRSSRLTKKRGKARKIRGKRDSEILDHFGAIDYEKLAEAIVKKQSEISKSSSAECSVNNISNSKVSPEPKPSTSTD